MKFQKFISYDKMNYEKLSNILFMCLVGLRPLFAMTTTALITVEDPASICFKVLVVLSWPSAFLCGKMFEHHVMPMINT